MGRRLLVRIEHDGDTDSPCEDDQFKVFSFSRKHVGYRSRDELFGDPDDPDDDRPETWREAFQDGTAFFLDYYEHGLCQWSLAGTHNTDYWDTSRRAGLLVWEGEPSDIGATPEDRKKVAANFIEAYTQWCNGECYLYSITDELTDDEVDSCGGFIGDESVTAALRDYLRDDDDIMLVPTETYDPQYLVGKLKGKVRVGTHFPVLPLPEYAI